MPARPTAGLAALGGLVADDTGTVTAVWTGRRAIGGISLGRRVAIEGVAGHARRPPGVHQPRIHALPR